MGTKKAKLKDLRDINRVLKNVKEKENKVIFGIVSSKEDLFVIIVSNASYHQGYHSVAGEMILLGNEKRRWVLLCIGWMV